MKTIKTETFLNDYTPPSFLVKSIDLIFNLKPKMTTVISKIFFNPQDLDCDLILDGKDLKLNWIKINGKNVDLKTIVVSMEHLKVPKNLIPKYEFLWEAETVINPKHNTSLDGLYLSSGMYCTQCEAEGFRKITYFLDRPDILSIYKVRIESKEPILLSNGNLIQAGKGFAEWHDPWPKPSYLFALVAGKLLSFNDVFETKSGRKVTLKIYVKPKDIQKCSYAMDALKRAMHWDELNYQREYDLDLFMIVAVEDFNMGAMENKGLNIFNSKFILADPKTATDNDYDFIERIIAHEYFHNWTGNRITCRDWFQLCLKEGLTVFRDQQFSADMRGHSIKRIEEVENLRSSQFREDDGPLSHPVRPEKYLEINNFYTATIYEKGAEIVRMLRLIVGVENYNLSLQKYFELYDGKACTIEDWLDVFEIVSGKDLSQFFLWYTEKGRPTVKLNEKFENGTYTLEFTQTLKNGLNIIKRQPMVIPIVIGLIDKFGIEILENQTVLLTKEFQSIQFTNLKSKPIPSVLRSFSAPITLSQDISQQDMITLATHDTDSFSRWESLRILSLNSIDDFINKKIPISEELISSLVKQLCDTKLAPSFRALIASAPTQESIFNHLASKSQIVEPTIVYKALNQFNRALAKESEYFLMELFEKLCTDADYIPNAHQSGQRALKLRVLDLLVYSDKEATIAKELFKSATNMTDEMGTLIVLLRHDKINEEIDDFYSRWSGNNLVIDKWFSVQATHTIPQKSIQMVKLLSEHTAFKWKNPNRFRSLIGSFSSGNQVPFNDKSGKGYVIVTDWLIKLDTVKPQTAARMSAVFDNWRIFDTKRQNIIKKNLERLINRINVSKNTYEIVNSILKS